MIFIKDFKEIGKGDAAIAGGKGASLGEMTVAGIPVPPGFVILAPAFEKFLDETDLNTEIDTILHTVRTDEMRSVEHASEKIQKLILEAKMPQDIGKEIQKNFKVLDAEFVAVRSSATAEDSNSAAWAGQLDTFLNTTEKDLLLNVQKCWASLFTPRAIFYRFEKGLHATKISVAVVVQKMIQSEISGIAFSVHPVTEDRNQLIIEAGWGLGEAIVSGQITPDSYVVEKDPQRIIDTTIAVQERGIYRVEKKEPARHTSASDVGGNEWVDVPREKKEQQKLTTTQILELAELVIKIENHYNFPCDIEWALEKNIFYITQSRPITTLSTSEPVKKKTNSEQFPRIAHYLSQPMVKMGQWRLLPADQETWHGEHAARYFEEFFGFPKGLPNIYVVEKGISSNYTPQKFFDKLFAYIHDIISRDYLALEKKLSGFSNLKRETKKKLAKISDKNYSRLTNEELAEAYRKNRYLIHYIVLFDNFGMSAENYWSPLMHRILTEKLHLVPETPEYNQILFTLTKPKEVSTSLEEKKDVLEKALKVIKKKQKIEEAARDLQKEYGWLPVFAYGTPWDSDHYVEELKQLIEKDEKYLKKEYEKLRDYEQIREKEIKSIIKRYSMIPEDLQIFIDFGLAVDARNEAEFVVSFGGYCLLPIYREISHRLGISEKDLRLLFEKEIVDCLEGRAEPQKFLAGKGKFIGWGYDDAMHERFNLTEEEAQILYEYLEANTKTSGQIESNEKKGICASSGKVRGKACILKRPEENSKVKTGDILISYATTVDYLPAMKNAAAIVTETGGLTCHAAVVSREFGIPCIVGLKGAMSDFKDGDLVEVDADKGVVAILKKADSKQKKKG